MYSLHESALNQFRSKSLARWLSCFTRSIFSFSSTTIVLTNGIQLCIYVGHVEQSLKVLELWDYRSELVVD